MKEYEQKYYFRNKALLESVAQITEMTKSDHPMAAARVKLAGKMVMLPPLFDGTKPEVAKQHCERFNQYIKFQTNSSNIRDPIGEGIELFEHTLDKKELVWFQKHKDKFVDLTTLKTMFFQRYNPWGKTKQDQLQSWNILAFNPQKMDVDEHVDLINTLGDMLGQTEESKMEKFIDTMPTIIQTHLITEKTWQETTDKAKELEHIIRKCDPPGAKVCSNNSIAVSMGSISVSSAFVVALTSLFATISRLLILSAIVVIFVFSSFIPLSLFFLFCVFFKAL